MAQRLVADLHRGSMDTETLQEILPNENRVAEELKNEGVLESVLVKTDAPGAFLVFTETDVEKVKTYVQRLPLYKYFDHIEYTLVEKAF